MFQQIVANYVHLAVMTVSIRVFVTHVTHNISSGLTHFAIFPVLMGHSKTPQHLLVIHALPNA